MKEEDSGAGSGRALAGKVHGLEVFSDAALGARGFLENVPVLFRVEPFVSLFPCES